MTRTNYHSHAAIPYVLYVCRPEPETHWDITCIAAWVAAAAVDAGCWWLVWQVVRGIL